MSATNPILWSTTLNPGLYEPERAAAALQDMHAAGYNVVRVFVDCCRQGINAGSPNGGISPVYVENVIDFLNKAKANQVYVLLDLGLTPAQGGYDELWQSCCTRFDGENLRYLTTGGHSAKRRFDRDFIRALITRAAPLDAIFAFDLTNEVHFSLDMPPFSLSSGRVTTANKKTYDMANPEDKQRMMAENLVYWLDEQRANILQVDPTALVTASFLAIYLSPGNVYPGPSIWESTLDFVDVHTYLRWGITLEQYMSRYGVDHPESPSSWASSRLIAAPTPRLPTLRKLSANGRRLRASTASTAGWYGPGILTSNRTCGMVPARMERSARRSRLPTALIPASPEKTLSQSPSSRRPRSLFEYCYGGVDPGSGDSAGLNIDFSSWLTGAPAICAP
jgi:hypothetical protein